MDTLSSSRNSLLSPSPVRSPLMQDLQINVPNSQALTSRCFKSVDHLSEKVNPIWKVRAIPDDVLSNPEIMQPPTEPEIRHFLQQLFAAADLCAETAIVSLIYLERLLLTTHISLSGINVFRSILCSVMMAAKIWDDQAVWNVDFQKIMTELNLQSLNTMEKWWLRAVNWRVDVKRSVFANYWFEVRECSEHMWGLKLRMLK